MKCKPTALMGVLLLLFVAFASVPSALAGKAEDFFAKAVKKYQEGDYPGAINLYEVLLKDIGLESAAVYFNLGNSYFKRGDLGKAVLSYLRAQRLSPRDADIRQNLSFARQMVQRYEVETQRPEKYPWVGVFRGLSDEEFKWLAAVAIMLTGGVFLSGLYAGLPSKRIFLLTGISSVCALYILAAYVVTFLDQQGRAVILTKSEARFEPVRQATVYFNVSEGEELKIVREKDGWIKIQRSDGRQGWIPQTTAGQL